MSKYYACYSCGKPLSDFHPCPACGEPLIEEKTDGHLAMVLDWVLEKRLVCDLSGLDPEDIEDFEIEEIEDGKMITIYCVEATGTIDQLRFRAPSEKKEYDENCG